MNNVNTVKQIEAVKEYINQNNDTVYIHETKKDSSAKIHHSLGVNHVSCKMTKAGNYSFKVWLAV
jgi:hypothetical protein